jgi:Holliday junction resolvase RusA-like endonuclease
MSKIQFILTNIKPTPLNKLHIPIIRNGKPTKILSSEARQQKKLIQMEAIRQNKTDVLQGHITFYMDILVKKIKSPDIDALLKQLLDAFEGIYYKNDKQIVDLRVRKHFNSGKDEIVIEIKEISI